MPTHAEKRFFPYTQKELFALVADVKAYPEFLPWCQEVLIHRHTPQEMDADLMVGFGFLKETFSSHVAFTPWERIDVTYTKGPFRYLNNHWLFLPDAEKKGCFIDFFIDFEFRNSLFQGMINPFFEEAVRRMMGAFEKRAETLFHLETCEKTFKEKKT